MLAALLTLSGTASLQAANTVQDFRAIFPDAGGGNAAPLLSFDGTPGDDYTVEVVNGVNGGKAIKLTDEANGQNNGLALNQLVSGDFSKLEIGFDLSFSPGNGGGADGIGFAYASSAQHGATNSSVFPGWGTAEEPNLGGSLGIGFDTFNNTDLADNGENSVSLHWDNAKLDSVGLDDPTFLESGDLLRADIVIAPAVGGSNVSVTLRNTVTNDIAKPYDNYLVPGLTSYNGRPIFKARTGGANSEQVIDNLSLKLTPTTGAVQTAAENFESYPLGAIVPPPESPLPPLVGGTPFANTKAGSDPGVRINNDNRPNAGAQPGHLQLTANTGSQVNSIAFPKTDDKADNIEAAFKFRVKDSGNNADGFTFMILDAATHGNDGPLATGFSEEPNLGGALGIGFDTFDNDEEGAVDETGCGGGGSCADRRANHISLHWDGAIVGEFKYLDRADFDLVNGVWNDARVLATPAQGGMNVTVTMTDGKDGSVHVLFADEFVSGLAFPQGARAAFGGRTGGAASEQSIDDVNIRWTGTSNPYDYNSDGVLNVADLDTLRSAIAGGSSNLKFDVDSNGKVERDDLKQYVERKTILNTYIGDANLDGQFNSGDLVTVFSAGEYEDAAASNSTWAEGDWNADNDFNTGDLVFAFQGGGYEMGPRAAVNAVPEPSSAVLLALGMLTLARRRRN
jgi:hypothetical protein